MPATSETDFRAFVKRQNENAARVAPDFYPRQKAEWLALLGELYAEIRGYLVDYIEEGTVSVDASPIKLTEENLGSYEVDQLTVYIGNRAATFTPIGALVIGSKGRVDVTGEAGQARLILVREHIHSPEA